MPLVSSIEFMRAGHKAMKDLIILRINRQDLIVYPAQIEFNTTHMVMPLYAPPNKTVIEILEYGPYPIEYVLLAVPQAGHSALIGGSIKQEDKLLVDITFSANFRAIEFVCKKLIGAGLRDTVYAYREQAGTECSLLTQHVNNLTKLLGRG